MVIFLFSAYFGCNFRYHSNGKSQSYLGLLHFGYLSNDDDNELKFNDASILWGH